MKPSEGFLNSMREAMMVLRTRGPTEATEVIQRALRGDPSRPAAGGAEAGAHTLPLTAKRAPAPLPLRSRVSLDVEDRSHFDTLTYSNTAGRRQYRLYVPATATSEPMPLVVMLHGCTQSADDFAAGTQMNSLAEQNRCLVAYPTQPRQANPSQCWNWFKPGDQRRECGEPSLIAGITREIIARHPVDCARVYIAGMSAGGAMAAVMIDQYPELYAAAGIHSGLPARCAHDLPSALAAMKGGNPSQTFSSESQQRPLIVFHGDADGTVNVANAARIVRAFGTPTQRCRETCGPGSGLRDWTRTHLVSGEGVEAELWTVHGASHAWAGGDTRGSYTDPAGPDASAEMLRFFLDHPIQQESPCGSEAAA